MPELTFPRPPTSNPASNPASTPELNRRPSSTFSISSSSPSSRRQSLMLPPPLPAPSVNSAPQDPNVDRGPGPQRHPRPLTAAELHLQLEKEQEAVVNRLTRELTLLRSQQSPVLADDLPYTSTPSMRARSSSNTSVTATSIHTNAATAATSLSRQNSLTGSNRTGRSSPALSVHGTELYPSPPLSSSLASSSGWNYGSGSDGSIGGSLVETMAARNELEVVKRENEVLRRRVRELERIVRAAREREKAEGKEKTEEKGKTEGKEEKEKTEEKEKSKT